MDNSISTASAKHLSTQSRLKTLTHKYNNHLINTSHFFKAWKNWTAEIDENVTPVAQGCQDEAQRVKAPTPWLSQFIPIPVKSGNIQLVLDMRMAYQTLKRRRVQMPTEHSCLSTCRKCKELLCLLKSRSSLGTLSTTIQICYDIFQRMVHVNTRSIFSQRDP